MNGQLPFPTDEECQWVATKLSERNPEIFDLKTVHNPDGKLTPDALIKAVVSVWIAQRASTFGQRKSVQERLHLTM